MLTTILFSMVLCRNCLEEVLRCSTCGSMAAIAARESLRGAKHQISSHALTVALALPAAAACHNGAFGDFLHLVTFFCISMLFCLLYFPEIAINHTTYSIICNKHKYVWTCNMPQIIMASNKPCKVFSNMLQRTAHANM